MGSPTCFSMLLGYSGTRTYVFHCLPYFYLCGSLSAAPLPVFRCLYTYGCVLHSLSLSLSLFFPLSLCCFCPCVPLPVIFLSLSYTVWYSHRSVTLPVSLYLCVPLPPLLLCFSASLLIYPSYTASGTPIPVFHRLSTYTCVFHCVRCSYPRVPSALYLASLYSTASFAPVPVFHCLYYFYLVLHCVWYSSARASLPLLSVSLCSITCTSSILIFHRLCYLYPWRSLSSVHVYPCRLNAACALCYSCN